MILKISKKFSHSTWQFTLGVQDSDIYRVPGTRYQVPVPEVALVDANCDLIYSALGVVLVSG